MTWDYIKVGDTKVETVDEAIDLIETKLRDGYAPEIAFGYEGGEGVEQFKKDMLEAMEG